MTDTRCTIENYCEGRGLSESKETLLRYACSVADSYEIELRPKGRSLFKLHFDCGAYKGEEIITFNAATISPMRLALELESLTSGHRFSYPEADIALLNVFKRRMSA